LRSSGWQAAPGAVVVTGDNLGNIHTGPTYVQISVERIDRVHDAIFDPTPLYEQLDLARFQGRRDLIAWIDERIAAADRGYVVVRGEAGVGKSTLAAYLAWNRACAYHFTRLAGGARSPVEARRSLAAQLIVGWNLSAQFTPGGVFPAGADRPDWLAKVIQAAVAARDEQFAPGDRRPLVLLVDGLDEADADPEGMGTGIPLGLPAPDALPSGVHIVATSRIGFPLVALRDPLRVAWSEIEVDSAGNLQDMADYLDAVTCGPGADPAVTRSLAEHDVPAVTLKTALLDRCHGEWVYLRYVLDEIRAGLRSPDDVASLPGRLRRYYEVQILDRWGRDPGWDDLHLPALAVLVALRRPVQSTELAEILDRTDPHAARQVASWLDGPARAFLDVAVARDRQRTYTVRHESLRDLFSAAEDDIGAGLADQLRSALHSAHRAIADWLIPAGTASDRDWTAVNEYTRVELPGHAAAGGVLESLMSDPGFLLHCQTWQILRHRHTLRTAEAVAAVAAAEATDGGHPGVDPAWLLHLWARRTRATRLADALVDGHAWPWYVRTAIWSGTTHRVLHRGDRRIRAIAVVPGPGGRYHIAVADGARSLGVWDAEAGTPVAELTGHTADVIAVTSLPRRDGRHHLVTGSTDGTVRIWDTATWNQIAELTGHTADVVAVTSLPRRDGRHHLVTGSTDGTVRIWDTATWNQIAELTGEPGWLGSTAMFPNSRGRFDMIFTTIWIGALAVLPVGGGRHAIATAGRDKAVWIWDPDTGEQLAKLTGHTGVVTAIAALPEHDGQNRIVTADADQTVRTWDTGTWTLIVELTGHRDFVTAMTVLPELDGRFQIVTGSMDHTVRTWDPDSGEQLAELAGHAEAVTAVDVLPGSDGRYSILTASADHAVRVWKPTATAHVAHTSPVTAVAILPAARGQWSIVSGSTDRTVRIWDPDTGEQLAKLTGHTDTVTAVAVLPERYGRHSVVTGSADRTVRIWDPDTGEQLAKLTGHTGTVTAIAIALVQGRHHILTGSVDRTVRIWDPDTRTELAKLTGHTDTVAAIDVRPDSDGRCEFLTASDDKTVRLWRLAPDGHPADVATASAQLPVWAAAWVPDGNGRYLVCSSADRWAAIWDPDTGQHLAGLTGHMGRITAIAPLPTHDGRRRIVTASEDRTVRIWDQSTGAEIVALTGHTGPVAGLATVPGHGNEGSFVTGSHDGTVVLWAPDDDHRPR
jgi:WD40 repeat protein